MKTAYIAATKRGCELALRLAMIQSGDVYAKRGRASCGAAEYDSLAELVARIFKRYDNLVFIMATGIVVRMIAPHIVHKSSDPAVVVLDEKGSFVISLLSGHLGGANDLARFLAEKIAARPVITTATDVNGELAADNLAKSINLTLQDFSALKFMNGRLAKGESVNFLIDDKFSLKDVYAARFSAFMKENKREAKLNFIDIEAAKNFSPAVLITDKRVSSDENLLVLEPRGICAGIGCRRGIKYEKLYDSLQKACQIAAVDMREITCLSSTVAKADEEGLIELAAKLKLPIKFWQNDCLEEIIKAHGLEESAFVKKQIGVGNICEAAALKMSQTKKILLPKEKLDKVTVALAWVR
jgi:cobalt-precorrin 5A hydrolase